MYLWSQAARQTVGERQAVQRPIPFNRWIKVNWEGLYVWLSRLGNISMGFCIAAFRARGGGGGGATAEELKRRMRRTALCDIVEEQE